MVSYKYYQEDGDITLKLDTALGEMCDGVGLPLSSTNYYDFRYPNANRIMIVVDGQWVEGTNTFDIKIPMAPKLAVLDSALIAGIGNMEN
jgi:hypothetical protein